MLLEYEMFKNFLLNFLIKLFIDAFLQDSEFFTFFQTLCNLEFFNATKENVIIAGKLIDDSEYTKLSPAEILQKEKVIIILCYCKIHVYMQ